MSVLIMLLSMFEFLLAVWLIFFIMRVTKAFRYLDSQVSFFKKGIINPILEYRVSLKMLNLQAKSIQEEIKVKQFFDALNILATLSLFLGLKKKL